MHRKHREELLVAWSTRIADSVYWYAENKIDENLVGTWITSNSDGGAAEGIELELRCGGTYRKTLKAGVPYGTLPGSATYLGTHQGTPRSQGSTVFLSGD